MCIICFKCTYVHDSNLKTMSFNKTGLVSILFHSVHDLGIKAAFVFFHEHIHEAKYADLLWAIVQIGIAIVLAPVIWCYIREGDGVARQQSGQRAGSKAGFVARHRWSVLLRFGIRGPYHIGHDICQHVGRPVPHHTYPVGRVAGSEVIVRTADGQCIAHGNLKSALLPVMEALATWHSAHWNIWTSCYRPTSVCRVFTINHCLILIFY